MKRFSIMCAITGLVLSAAAPVFAAGDITHGQETFHKWVKIYDRKPDTVFVDQNSVLPENSNARPAKAVPIGSPLGSGQGEATIKHLYKSPDPPHSRELTEVNHVKVNCPNNTYSVRFQAEYLPNGSMTKTKTFDDQHEFQKPTTHDTYYQDVINFVCDQVR